MRASNDSQRQWRKQRWGNRSSKSDDLLSELQTCVKFVAVVFGSSARWMMSIAGMVES